MTVFMVFMEANKTAANCTIVPASVTAHKHIVLCEAGVDIVMCEAGGISCCVWHGWVLCSVVICLHDPRLLHAPHPEQQGPVPRGTGAHLRRPLREARQRGNLRGAFRHLLEKLRSFVHRPLQVDNYYSWMFSVRSIYILLILSKPKTGISIYRYILLLI